MKKRFKLWLLMAIGLGFLTAPVRAEFLYAINSDDNTISVYHIGRNGSLALVTGSPVPTGESPASLALDPSGRSLYVANSGSKSVSSYRVSERGALTPAGVASTGSVPTSLNVDRFGRFLYVANSGLSTSYLPVPGNVLGFRIEKNGSLAPIPGPPVAAGIDPEAVVTDPWGRFVYAANSGTQEISTETTSGYRVMGNGSLVPMSESPFPEGAGAEDAVMDPWGRFLYIANFYDGVVSAYQVGPSGALKPVPGSPFQCGVGSNSIVIDPRGQFLYVNGLPNSLSGFRIAANGVLTPLSGSPFNFELEFGAMAVDLSGQFLFASTRAGVTGYRINANGTLTPLSGSPFQIGFTPYSMVVGPGDEARAKCWR